MVAKNCRKIIYFFPKNGLILSPISSLEIKKNIEDRALVGQGAI